MVVLFNVHHHHHHYHHNYQHHHEWQGSFYDYTRIQEKGRSLARGSGDGLPGWLAEFYKFTGILRNCLCCRTFIIAAYQNLN